MNSSCRITALAAACVVAGAAALPGDAVAAARQIASQATNYCQTALPVFDGNIRKRPLAVQNEGAGNAFITCSYPTGEGRSGGSNTTRVWQYFVNNSEEDITMNCTGVSGTVVTSAQYVPKSVVVPAGSGSSTQISWFAADFDGAPAVFPNQGVFSISCLVPPGAGLRQSYVDSDEDIGT